MFIKNYDTNNVLFELYTSENCISDQRALELNMELLFELCNKKIKSCYLEPNESMILPLRKTAYETVQPFIISLRNMSNKCKTKNLLIGLCIVIH